MRVGVVGGGAAGLAAAYELSKAGVSVALYERAPFLGGQASTFDVAGARLERGYHHLFNSDTDIISLMEEIGLGDRVRYIESKVGTLYDGRIYNFVTPIDLLKFTPLGLVDRFRLGLVTLMLQRMKDWRRLEDVTANEWLRRKAGRRAYEVFWGPMLRGKFGESYYEQVTMAWIWGKVHTRFASRGKGLSKEMLVYPEGSFGEVFDVLGEKVSELGGEIFLSRAVTEIAVEDGRAVGLNVADAPATWTSPQPLADPEEGEGNDADGGLGTPSFEPFDAVISTVPSYSFARLLPSLPDEYMDKLTGVRYMSAVLLILVLDRPLSHVYWLNVADRSIPFVGVIEQTNLLGPEHYGGKHVVYLSNYLSREHPMYRMEHRELLDAYAPHLKKINPEFDPSWIRGELPPQGGRGAAHHRHRVLPTHPGAPDARGGRLPGKHDAGLSGGPRHQLQRAHRQTRRGNGAGGLCVRAGGQANVVQVVIRDSPCLLCNVAAEVIATVPRKLCLRYSGPA